MPNEVPRRARIDKCIPAELAICDAMLAVEALPLDVRLTEAMVALHKARNLVADWVDAALAEKRREALYRWYLANGTSDHEARGNAWPDDGKVEPGTMLDMALRGDFDDDAPVRG